MRVFISYSREASDVATAIFQAIKTAGFDGFLDQHDLPIGQDYNTRIADAIANTDLVVFIASPRSLEPSSYAMLELRYVEQKWRNPSGYVLPILALQTTYDDLPAYLRQLTAVAYSNTTSSEVVGWVQSRLSSVKAGVVLGTGSDRAKKLAQFAQPPAYQPTMTVNGIGTIPTIFLVAIVLAAAYASLYFVSAYLGRTEVASLPFGLEPSQISITALVVVSIVALLGCLAIGSFNRETKRTVEGNWVASYIVDQQTDAIASQSALVLPDVIFTIDTADGSRLTLRAFNNVALQNRPSDVGWSFIGAERLVEFVRVTSY
jgi:hypothetical protein